MSLSVKVLGCNGMCGSCYENRIRSKSALRPYDIKSILASLKREIDKIPKEHRDICQAPVIHGGEPLLLKFEDLERILNLVHEEFGHSGVQTNGLLIKDEHLDLFKKYKTHVGFSLDGDLPQTNFGRWNADPTLPLNAVENGTRLVLQNMKLCTMVGINISVITILRRYNAAPHLLPSLKRFLFRLKDEFHCTDVRTNEGIVYDYERFPFEELSPGELGYAFVYLADLCLEDSTLIWSPFRDVVDLLLGYKEQTCGFGECDPWKTSSEITICEDGHIGCCLKTGGSVDGLNMLAADLHSYERYSALLQVPEEFGGCKGCKFWTICKGGCPGTGIGNDWRNRTRFCESWKVLFEHIATKIKGLMPNITVTSDIPNSDIDSSVTLSSLNPNGSSWKKHKRVSIEKLMRERKEQLAKCSNHGDSHGDRPHGDSWVKVEK